MKTKLSNKEVFLSVLTFIVSYVVLLVIMVGMIAINLIGSEQAMSEFLKINVNNLITVAISAAVFAVVVYVYFFFENKRVLARCGKIIELYLILGLAMVLCNIVGKFVSPTARPLVFFSLMTAMFFKRKDAIFVNCVYALLLFIFNRYLNSPDLAGGSMPTIDSFTGLLVIFCAGVLGIFILRHIKTRIACVTVALILIVPVLIINTILKLPSSEAINWTEIGETMLFSALDCIFSVILFMFLMPVFETLFSELTSFRLRELTSDNAKLIRKMKATALGTYNHSIVVAQLAEACASELGEDPELARAAAYYHDIGKLKNPEMFTENQTEYDLHKELTPELSVDIIRSHTRDGAKLIKKNRLPEFFADVAVEHHGTLPIKYFYAKALKMSDGELNSANYSYAGPTPTTKIAAIIMIADASEAATRSLPDRSPEKVEALVSSLIEERMNLDQFVDCDITMRELTVITRTLVNRLTGVYHSRIQYPKLVLSKNKKQ